MTQEQVIERVGTNNDQMVMPFYIICDVSYSMVNDMSALNAGLQRLRRKIISEPVVHDVARLSIMKFSDNAAVVVPMGRFGEGDLPTLTAEAGTNYGSAFRLLAQQIEQDFETLKQENVRVFRPCAFFLTDGEPLDGDWRQTFQATLTYDKATEQGNKRHPVFVPFGFRDATEDVMKALAYPPPGPERKGSQWFLARSHDIEKCLEAVLDIIMKTVVTSGLTANDPKPTHSIQSSTVDADVQQGTYQGQDDFLN